MTLWSYIDTTVSNGTEYSYRVYAANAVGSSIASNVASVVPGTNSFEPAAPNLDITGATTVSTSSNVASLASSASNNAVFYFPNGTYTNFHDVVPKQGQRFIGQSKTGVIISGQNTWSRALKGKNHGWLVANMTFQNFSNGVWAQNEAVIDAKSTEWDEGSLTTAHDVRVHNCNFYDNKLGISLGHRWIIDGCHFEGHNPHAIGSGYATGGTIYGNTFKDNGFVGGAGVGVNNAQIKLHWHNIGPWGDTANDTSRHILYGGSTPFNASHHNYETPQEMIIAGNTFNGARNTTKYGAGNNARAIWMDIDCRDIRLTDNTFNDTWYFGIFAEGCNGIEIDNNTFNGQDSPYFNSLSNGFQPNGPYWGQAAIAADVSDNINVHDNTLHNCVGGSIIFFLGDRGRNGADWVTDEPTGWPIARDDRNQMIRRTYAPIALHKSSTVGSSNCQAINNTLTGTSLGVGYVLDDGNLPSEYNNSTFNFQGNVYPTGGPFRNFFNGVRYNDKASWSAATGFDV